MTTYDAPDGSIINLCPDCERVRQASGDWPRNALGQEFAAVLEDLHEGECDVCRWAAERGGPNVAPRVGPVGADEEE